MAWLSQHNLSLIFHHFIPPLVGHVVSHHGSCHFSHRKKITTVGGGEILENFHYFWHSIFCWRICVRIPTRNSISMTMSRMLGAGNPHLAASLSCTFQRVVERHCLEHENYVSDPREASIFIGCKGLFYKVVVCNDPFVLLLLFDPPLTQKKKHHRRFWVVAWLHPHLPTAPTEKMGLRFLCGRFWGCVSIDPRSSNHSNRWHVGVLVGYCNRRIGAKDLSIEPWMQNPYILVWAGKRPTKLNQPAKSEWWGFGLSKVIPKKRIGLWLGGFIRQQIAGFISFKVSEKRRCETWIFCQIGTPQKCWGIAKKKRL